MIQTHQGYEDPYVRQIAIFLQNKVGELSDVLRHLQIESIEVHGLSVTDSIDFAVIRLIVDKVDAAQRVLKEMDVPYTIGPVLAVEIPEESGAMLSLCRALLSAEVNTNYVYALTSRPRGRPIVIVHVDNQDMATEALLKRNYHLVEEIDFFDGHESGENWT